MDHKNSTRWILVFLFSLLCKQYFFFLEHLTSYSQSINNYLSDVGQRMQLFGSNLCVALALVRNTVELIFEKCFIFQIKGPCHILILGSHKARNVRLKSKITSIRLFDAFLLVSCGMLWEKSGSCRRLMRLKTRVKSGYCMHT